MVGLVAMASSGLQVSFGVASGPATISGGTNLAFTGVGEVSVVASQAGDANWNPAPDATNMFNVLKASQAALSFTPASPQSYNATNILSATGGSGTGPVSYAVLSGPGEIVGADGLKAASGTGEIVVEATKGADDLYLAQSVSATVTVQKADQVINFPAIGDKLTTDLVGLAATASSGLAAMFAVGAGPGTIAGGTNLTFTGAGSVSIVASQAGDVNWNAAPDETNTFSVAKAAAMVYLQDLMQAYDGTARTVPATTMPAGLTVSITYDGSATAPTNAGTYAVTGTISEVMYQGSAVDSLVVAKAAQSIDFPAIGDKLTTDTVGLAAPASSGLPVSFAVANGPAAIANGTNLSFTGEGEVSIVASQAGDANWNAAPDVTNTFQVIGYCELEVVSAHGAPEPGVGSHNFVKGTVITNVLAGSPEILGGVTQLVCTGWTMVGNEPESGAGTNFVANMTNDAVLTWHWTTNFWLDTEAGVNGEINVADGWLEAGDEVLITATASNGYHFSMWGGDTDGCTIVGNQITVLMDKPRTITAAFEINIYGITATAGVNGSVIPSGVVPVTYGGSTSITIQAMAGAHISQILVDGINAGVFTPQDTTRSIAFSNIVSDHVLTASFNLRPAIVLTATPTNGVAPLRVVVDFSGSGDPDGTIARSEFDKDCDGLFETVLNGAGRTVVTYPEPGIYTATGVVYDAYGASGSSAVRIEVLGRNPEAILTASPTNGAAPLSVSFDGTNSTAAANHQIVVYEWDFNGDGRIDRITATGLATYVYASPGIYQAVLRVTDDQGLTGSATLAISIEPPVLVPPTVILTASTNAGYLPLDVVFMAEATDDGQVVQYRWDFDGDGSIDSISSNNAANYRYTVAGAYNPRVVVVDNDGLSASDNVQIQVSTEPEKYKVWLTQPKDGDRIWGNQVTVDGHVAPAKDTVSVQFQYKPEAETVWLDLGAPIYPQPRDYKTVWDVTGLTDGATYHLRAVATLEAQQVATSGVYAIMVDSSEDKTPGKVKEDDSGGVHTRQATFDSGQTLNTRAFDGTGVVIPAGTVESNTTVEIVLVGANTNDANGSVQGQANINANRKVSLEGNPELSQMMTITIPYPDADQDGYVDGTAVPEPTLTVHWYDTDSGQWRKAYSSTVYPDDNYVQAVVHHLTEFGVFGTMNLLDPANGGVLETFTSESPDGATKALNLTDGNTVSYWRSEGTPDTNQIFVYSFTNYMGAVLTKAVFNNYGENSSRDFEVQASMDGVNYDTVASGTLLTQESAQEFPIGNIVCRTVKLVVSSGATADAWELAEFAVHGTLTDDPDDDGMADWWEMLYFGDFSRDGTGDQDEEGLLDGQEHDFGTNPLLTDTDGDGQSDWAESIAGTGGTDEQDFFSIKEIGPASEEIDPLVLYWDTVSGRTYRLLYGLSMTGNWDAATQVLETPGDGQRKSYTNENSDRTGFYRLSVEKP